MPTLKIARRPSASSVLCPCARRLWLSAQQPLRRSRRRAPASAFPQKQTLTYAVDWRVFPAGTAVIHFERDGDRERISATADTIGAINLLFHVGDSFQSDFDRAEGCTYEFDKQTVEGRRQINSTLHLDYAQSKSHPRREEPGHRADQAR